MFRIGELISRYSKIDSPKGHCVVVDIDGDNYTLYNNSLKCLQRVACVVVERLYKRIDYNVVREEPYEMT